MHKHHFIYIRDRNAVSCSKQVEQEKTEMLQKYQSRAKNILSTAVDIVKTKGNDAAEEILHIANKENIDTIVVGSRGFTASKDFLLGSISYKVMHYAKCPVVIVRWEKVDGRIYIHIYSMLNSRDENVVYS